MEKHSSILNYLLGMNPIFTGISEIQRELLMLIAEGYSDKEMALKLGVARSTIRNHRYKLREKKKLIVLSEIAKNFSKGKKYSEKEINRILKRIYEDYATIRRALIEYGFVERSNDCSSYWVKE